MTTKSKMSFEERLVNLEYIHQYLVEERNFAMKMHDWPRVSVFKQKLKTHSEILNTLRFKSLEAA